MKEILLLALLILIASCGGGGDGGGASTDGVQTATNGALWVNLESELPTCNTSNKNVIYYIQENYSWKYCDGSAWKLSYIQRSIVYNKQIESTTTDFCAVTGEQCSLQGGQIVKFTDGSFQITVMWEYLLQITGDNDGDFHTIASIAEADACELLGYSSVDGTNYKNTWVCFDHSEEVITIREDTDDDGTVNSGDTVLLTATISNW